MNSAARKAPQEKLVYLRRKRHHDRKRAICEVVKTYGKTTAFPRRASEIASPNEPDTTKLARLIAYAPHDGSFDLHVPYLHVSRYSRINKECVHTLQLSSLCVIAQGAKTVIVGQEVYSTTPRA